MPDEAGVDAETCDLGITPDLFQRNVREDAANLSAMRATIPDVSLPKIPSTQVPDYSAPSLSAAGQ